MVINRLEPSGNQKLLWIHLYIFMLILLNVQLKSYIYWSDKLVSVAAVSHKPCVFKCSPASALIFHFASCLFMFSCLAANSHVIPPKHLLWDSTLVWLIHLSLISHIFWSQTAAWAGRPGLFFPQPSLRTLLGGFQGAPRPNKRHSLSLLCQSSSRSLHSQRCLKYLAR